MANVGKVTQIIGPVVDIRFSKDLWAQRPRLTAAWLH